MFNADMCVMISGGLLLWSASWSILKIIGSVR
jgi:hypothetical protein